MTKTFKFASISALALPLATAGTLATAGGMAEPVEAAPPPPVPVAAPMPGIDWTGFYAGGQLGYGRLESDALTEEPEDLTYGVHAGYLHDFGTFILGAEVDVDGTNIEDETAGVALDSVARLKLRAGYDAGQFQPYLTAGVARATLSGAIDASDNGNFAGLGAEYRVSDAMKVGAEVLRHQFDDFDGTGVDIDATTLAARVSFQF